MKHFALIFMFCSLFSSTSLGSANVFSGRYLIRLQNLKFSVPGASQKYSIKVQVFLKGRSSGYRTEVMTQSLGKLPANTDVENLGVEPITIHPYNLESALMGGGLIANDPEGHDLGIQIIRYRTVMDKNHLAFTIPFEVLNDGSNTTKRFVVRDGEKPRSENYLEFEVTTSH